MRTVHRARTNDPVEAFIRLIAPDSVTIPRHRKPYAPRSGRKYGRHGAITYPATYCESCGTRIAHAPHYYASPQTPHTIETLCRTCHAAASLADEMHTKGGN